MLVTRIRRAADVTPAAIRASAGALLHLPLARVANIPRALDRLQDVGFTVVGLDGDAERVDLRRAVSGGARGARRRAAKATACRDWCASDATSWSSLPMRGRVGSLNASASLAAALYGYVLPSRRP